METAQATAKATKETQQKRCPCCNKKLALTDFACQCGIKHCLLHRLPEAHSCPVDFKTKGRTLLAAQLERVVGQKLEKI